MYKKEINFVQDIYFLLTPNMILNPHQKIIGIKNTMV